MNDQAQDNQPSEGQPIETAPQTPGEQQPAHWDKVKFIREFAVGFLGWYLVTTLLAWFIFNSNLSVEEISDMVVVVLVWLFQVIALIGLFFTRKTRAIAWGILSALGLNFVISLALGNVIPALCFYPFFTVLFRY